MLSRWRLFLLPILWLPVLSVEPGWASLNRYEQTDLAVVNHPDLFKSRWWRASQQPETEPEKLNPQKETPVLSKKIPLERPNIGKPIPLDRLDNSLVQRVFFDYKKATLHPNAKAGIQINAAWIKKHPEYDILLEGHCDKRGTSEYNIALGERRAESIRSYIIDFGIDPGRLYCRSWGEEKPLDSRDAESAYRLNRRVEFYAIPVGGG